MLSDVLCITYKSALRSRFHNSILIKYADNTINFVLIVNTDENNHKSQIGNISQLCQSYNLLLYVIQTKEFIFEFIYLNIIHNKQWPTKWVIYLNISVSLLTKKLFYTSMKESLICYNITLWWTSIRWADTITIPRICKQTARIIKTNISSIDDMYAHYFLEKAKFYVSTETHPLQYFSDKIIRALSSWTQTYDIFDPKFNTSIKQISILFRSTHLHVSNVCNACIEWLYYI